MSTPFVSMIYPPGNVLELYNHSATFEEQSDEIPPVFLDAISVREEVFVHEQKCPLEAEVDSDDRRSFHWVAYASVGAPSSSSTTSTDPAVRRQSTATKLPVATIRLVPPPHPSHTAPGFNIETPGEASGNPDNEPFVKIGRFATLEPFRKFGLGKLLITSILEWAPTHAKDILPPPSPTDREAARIDGHGNFNLADKWKGLILIHAQSHIQKYWAKFGFVKDEAMGEWKEEGIPHVGMWLRIPVKDGKNGV